MHIIRWKWSVSFLSESFPISLLCVYVAETGGHVVQFLLPIATSYTDGQTINTWSLPCIGKIAMPSKKVHGQTWIFFFSFHKGFLPLFCPLWRDKCCRFWRYAMIPLFFFFYIISNDGRVYDRWQHGLPGGGLWLASNNNEINLVSAGNKYDDKIGAENFVPIYGERVRFSRTNMYHPSPRMIQRPFTTILLLMKHLSTNQ